MRHCKYCELNNCVKTGFQKNGRQRYKCKSCGKYQQAEYTYKSWLITDKQICTQVKEGIGIRSMQRLMEISAGTVIGRIRKIAKSIQPPVPFKPNRVYEMDEVHTFVQKKSRECWISYAIERVSKQVVDFRIGGRTKGKLKHVIESILYRLPKRIYTDGYILYQTLIPHKKHRISKYGTNRIERHNLNLRIHLKRLARRTICFSKKQDMLEACMKIYFWG